MPSARAPAGLDDDEVDEYPRPDEVEIPPSSGEVDEPRKASTFDDSEILTVAIPKETDTTRIGIGLRPDMPERAVVHKIAPGTPSVGIMQAYDEIMAVGGDPVNSAVHAVQLIREAPAGTLHIELKRAPGLTDAARSVQEGMRNAMATREGLVRRTIFKESQDSILGLSFSPEYHVHSVIQVVKEGGLAATALVVGDLIRRLNGVEVTAPADTARMLRESSGRIELLVLPSHKVDMHEVVAVEEREAAERQQQEEAYREQERRRGAQAAGGADDARAGDDDEYEGEEEYEDEGEEDFSDEGEDEDDEDEDDQRARARMNEGVPPRPANLSHPTGAQQEPTDRPSPVRTGNARRLPPSLSGFGASSEPPSPFPDPSSTYGTRMAAPPLAKGSKPQGWREWLQQRKGAAATVPAPNSPRAAHPGMRNEDLQRV